MVGKKAIKKRHTTKQKAISRKKAPKKQESLYDKIRRKLDIRHDLPLGIRAFLTYLGILSLFYLFSGVITRRAVLLGISFEGVLATLFNFITAGIIALLMYGFAKKEIRYYYLSLGFFALILINTLLSIFAIRAGTVSTIRSLINIIFFLTLILNIVTLLFIISKKYYFLHPKPEYHVHTEDTIFITTLVIIWVLVLASSIFFINKYYQDSFPQADRIISDLQDRGVIESLYYCNINDNPDLCNYIGALMNAEDPNAMKLCNRIKLPFFYNDCVKTLNEA